MSSAPETNESSVNRVVAKSLRIFTDIKADEVRLTLALFSTVFLMLTAYYLAKPVRESWLAVSMIGDLSRIEVKAVSGGLQSIVLIALLPLYTKLYDIWPRRRLLMVVNLFFVAMFPIFWLLQPDLFSVTIPYAGVAFYIFIGIFAVSVVAQFWAYAADLYNEDAGKRLFPLIALGASAGGVTGSALASRLINAFDIPTFTMLLIAPLVLMLATYVLWRVETYDEKTGKTPSIVPDARPEDPRSAWKIVMTNRYILLIAMFVFLLNWVQTNGENILFAAVQEAIAGDAEISADARASATAKAYSGIFFWVSLIGLLLQAFIVSRLLRFGGVAGVLLIPPFVSLVSNGTMSATGGLGVLTVAKTAENATNYSIANTARHVLWLPVAKEALYKAKTAIDTVCFRVADGLAAITVIVGTRILSADTKSFFVFNLFLVIIWLGVGLMILRERSARRELWNAREAEEASPIKDATA